MPWGDALQQRLERSGAECIDLSVSYTRSSIVGMYLSGEHTDALNEERISRALRKEFNEKVDRCNALSDSAAVEIVARDPAWWRLAADKDRVYYISGPDETADGTEATALGVQTSSPYGRSNYWELANGLCVCICSDKRHQDAERRISRLSVADSDDLLGDKGETWYSVQAIDLNGDGCTIVESDRIPSPDAGYGGPLYVHKGMTVDVALEAVALAKLRAIPNDERWGADLPADGRWRRYPLPGDVELALDIGPASESATVRRIIIARPYQEGGKIHWSSHEYELVKVTDPTPDPRAETGTYRWPFKTSYFDMSSMPSYLREEGINRDIFRYTPWSKPAE